MLGVGELDGEGVLDGSGRSLVEKNENKKDWNRRKKGSPVREGEKEYKKKSSSGRSFLCFRTGKQRKFLQQLKKQRERRTERNQRLEDLSDKSLHACYFGF